MNMKKGKILFVDDNGIQYNCDVVSLGMEDCCGYMELHLKVYGISRDEVIRKIKNTSKKRKWFRKK